MLIQNGDDQCVMIVSVLETFEVSDVTLFPRGKLNAF